VVEDSVAVKKISFDQGNVVFNKDIVLKLCGLFGALRHKLSERQESKEAKENPDAPVPRHFWVEWVDLLHQLQAAIAPGLPNKHKPDDYVPPAEKEHNPDTSVTPKTGNKSNRATSGKKGQHEDEEHVPFGALPCTLENATFFENFFDISDQGGDIAVSAILQQRVRILLSSVIKTMPQNETLDLFQEKSKKLNAAFDTIP